MESYEAISPTAWGTAYQRTLTDIPLSKEIFEAVDALSKAGHAAGQTVDLEQWKYAQLTPMFEARYKLMNMLIQRHGSSYVVEIAAGFSPRGITMTQNPSLTYIEMDLPPIIRQKAKVIDRLKRLSVIRTRANLHLREGNILKKNEWVAALEGAPADQPLTIVNEGLLRYFNHEEKVTCAMHIRELLAKRGGVWMTPDVCAKGMNATGPLKEIVREQNERMLKLTGIDVRKNYFSNEEEARAFFEDMGFRIDRYPFTNIRSQLVSPEREYLTPEQVEDAIGTSAVYVMRVKNDKA